MLVGLVDDGRVVAVGVDVGGEAAPPRVARRASAGRCRWPRRRARRRRPRAAHGRARPGRSGRPHRRAAQPRPRPHEHPEHRRCCTVRLPSSRPSQQAATTPSRVQREGNVTDFYRPAVRSRGRRRRRQEVPVTLLDQRPVRRPPGATARRTARLLLVDGEAIVRFGLRQLFAADPDLAVVGEAAGPARRARARRPVPARPRRPRSRPRPRRRRASTSRAGCWSATAGCGCSSSPAAATAT